MDETDAYCLNSLKTYILANLDAKHVVDHLVEVEILETDEEELICSQPTAKGRTEKLLDILPRRPNGLKHFKKALAKDYQFVLQKLNEVEVPDHTGTAQGSQLAAQPHATRTTAGPNTTRPTGRSGNSTVTNIRGDNNFVIIGGHCSNINFHS